MKRRRLSPARRQKNARTTESEGPLSPKSMQAMSEDQLRTDVLMPLFRRMGYSDVQLYHGGGQEQGKDIVMWKSDDFGRVNLAVVVKARRINGRASGSGSAADVVFQIRQCFGRRFQDATTMEEQVVHECLVVCPHDIKKEALVAISSGIGDEYKRHVKYLCGHALWEKVREHLGPRAVLSDLERIGRVLEAADPHYRIVAKTAGAQISVAIEPKHPEAVTEDPLLINAKFEFPDDETGRAMLADLVKHVETGSPVKIPARYVKEWKMPPLIREIVGDRVGEISLEPVSTTESVRMSVEIVSANGETATLPELEFRCQQKGTREATFVAVRSPHRVTLVLRPADDSGASPGSISIGAELDNVNVALAFEAIRIRRLLSIGSKVTLRDGTTRLPAMSTEVPAGIADPYDEDLEALLADLIAIQDHTRVPISIPGTEWSLAELNEVRGIAAALRTGGVVPARISDCSVTLGRRAVERIIDPVAPTLRFAFRRDEVARVFGVDVPLGPVVCVVTGPSIAPEERARLLKALADPSIEEFEVRIDCADATCAALYVNYLSAEQRERYRSMFPDLDG